MDIFLICLIASILSALCIKYLANLKINIFLKILIITLFMTFVLFGLWVCFFLTIILLPFFREKPLVIGSSDIKKYEDGKIVKAIRKALIIKKKSVFFIALCCLVFISVVFFDSFRIYKFKLDCACGKDYDIEILDGNYTLKDLENKNISWNNHILYLANRKIAKFNYKPCMKYNNFMSKMLSIETSITTLCCDRGLNQQDRFEFTLKALKKQKKDKK